MKVKDCLEQSSPDLHLMLGSLWQLTLSSALWLNTSNYGNALCSETEPVLLGHICHNVPPWTALPLRPSLACYKIRGKEL